MRLLPKRFDYRISLIFWILLCCFGVIQGLSFHIINWRFNDELEQRLHWSVAEHLAQQLGPYFEKDASSDLLEQELHRITEVNPRLEVFILSDDGLVLIPSTLSEIKNKFPNDELIKRIQSFLEPKKSRSLPLYGVHPEYSASGFDRIFSAAKIRFKGRPAYLYVLAYSRKTNIFWRSLQDVYWYFSVGVFWVIISLVVIAVGTFLFFRATSRVRQITKAVRKISEGDFSEQISEEGSDEIAQLGTDINQMSQSIEQSIQSLEQTDQLRRELVANISHDLRTPIASMLAYLESVSRRDEIQSNPELKKQLAIAVANAAALSSLAQDLFELSRLETKDIKPNKEPFSILEVVTEDVVPRLEPLAAELDVALEVSAPDWLPLVLADQIMITRTLTNLIENAVKYSGEKSSVVIKLQENANTEEIQILVQDNGKGIAENDLPRIFDRFYRVDKARTKGRGLGLAIVKQILEAHNQKIDVESNEGVGTKFSFCLPLYRNDLSEEGKS